VLRDAHDEAWERLWSASPIETADTVLTRASRLHAFHILGAASPFSSHHDTGLPARGWQAFNYPQFPMLPKVGLLAET
jgi:trehalose/maltose hydrolase-like predicted phosphorylase